MGLKERRKKIMALMLAACVAGTSVVPVAASDVSVFSDGTDAAPETFDSADVDSATVATEKTIKINFYSEEEGKQIDQPEMNVPADATSGNTSQLTVPKGYELVEVGDLPIRDGYVYAEVRKAVTTKGITVVYQDRKGNVIKTAPMTVDKDATYINTGKLTAPAGYRIATTDSKFEISKNNTVTVEVKRSGKTIKVVYRLAKTNRIVTTRKIVVDKKATSIKASEVPVPAGYKMVTTGSCSVRTKKIEIYVKK